MVDHAHTPRPAPAGSSALGPSPADRPAHPTGHRFRDLFELAPEPYLLTDSEGRIGLANTRSLRLFARPREQVEGRNLADFLDPREHDGLRQHLARAATGEGIHAWEVRLAAGAAEATVLASVEPFAAPEGGIELRWVLWDAMPLELVRTRLQRLLEDSRGDAASLRALAEWQASLLGSAAQDMDTPLSVIAATVDSLLEDPSLVPDAGARAALERTAQQVTRLRQLLPTLLQLGRLQLHSGGPRRDHVALDEVLEEVLIHLDPLDCPVTYELEVVGVHADRDQLARVLVELVSHACEHSPPGAALRIGTVARGVDAELFLDIDGHAVPEHVAASLASPFRGAQRSAAGAHGHDGDGRHGTGERGDGDVGDLGLSLIGVFARMHGGRAWVQHREGGSSIHVLLSNALPDGHDELGPPGAGTGQAGADGDGHPRPGGQPDSDGDG